MRGLEYQIDALEAGMDARLRSRLRARITKLLDRGWGGCECPCHGGHHSMLHFRACCSPDHEEMAELCELLLQDPEFADLFAGLRDGELPLEILMLTLPAAIRR
jgi:hypothetical protein